MLNCDGYVPYCDARMMDRAAFHLPGLDAGRVRDWRFLEKGATRLRWPVLTRAQLQNVCDAITRNRQQHLMSCSVHEIVTAVDQAVKYLRSDVDDVTNLLCTYTGYSPQVVR